MEKLVFLCPVCGRVKDPADQNGYQYQRRFCEPFASPRQVGHARTMMRRAFVRLVPDPPQLPV